MVILYEFHCGTDKKWSTPSFKEALELACESIKGGSVGTWSLSAIRALSSSSSVAVHEVLWSTSHIRLKGDRRFVKHRICIPHVGAEFFTACRAFDALAEPDPPRVCGQCGKTYGGDVLGCQECR